MSQKQNKRDKYIYEILKYCYFKKRETLIRRGHYSIIFNIEGILSNFPREDKVFSEAAMIIVLNRGYLRKTPNSVQFASLCAQGVIFFEQTYNPTGVLHFSSLVYPFLSICYNLIEKNIRIKHVNEFIDLLKDEENLILKENEHWEVLHILEQFGWIRLLEGLGGTMEYMGITPQGVNHYLDSSSPNIIEISVNSILNKFLHLDYFPKEISKIKEHIYHWINQFTEEDDKKCAIFLLKNLWIVENQWCIDKFEEFFEKELKLINIDDIYIFAAGGSGSSAEYWRHKFVRGLTGGKENSRTLKTLENKKEVDFWDNKIIILVDDIIGSGDQFSDFTENFLISSNNVIQDKFLNSRIIYFTPVATELGINEIKNLVGGKIEIFYGELLKKLFHDDNVVWNKSTVLPKDKIEEICLNYATKLNLSKNDLLGYKDSQLLVVFQDHTPDNTIPLLWLETQDWKALLKR